MHGWHIKTNMIFQAAMKARELNAAPRRIGQTRGDADDDNSGSYIWNDVGADVQSGIAGVVYLARGNWPQR